jgi:hypothetical protein
MIILGAHGELHLVLAEIWRFHDAQQIQGQWEVIAETMPL